MTPEERANAILHMVDTLEEDVAAEIRAAIAEEREAWHQATDHLVCARDGHTLGCLCDCVGCKQRAAIRARP